MSEQTTAPIRDAYRMGKIIYKSSGSEINMNKKFLHVQAVMS